MHICRKEWDVIDGAICIPAGSAATLEQPYALRVMWRRGGCGRRAGFHVTVSLDSRLFCSLNVCKSHLQTLGQSSGSAILCLACFENILMGKEHLLSFSWRTFQLGTGGDCTKLTCRLSNFHQPHLWPGIMFYYSENGMVCGKITIIPTHRPHPSCLLSLSCCIISKIHS